ncbi:hypothetical protein [Haloarchaeobius sp. FL176]|uniref:hypothetical protein n=1 Tax=Haloarchaeobius sp. FL176 TaxID=2967129 RepID=UPI002148C3D4|nr:hypothetical protein [Haloarchaeobius sp. FL176]
MAERRDLGKLFEEHRLNAVVSWVLVAIVVLAAVEEVVLGDWLWTVFALAVAAVAVIPPVKYRRRLVMLPWEVLLLAALPVLGRTALVRGLVNDLVLATMPGVQEFLSASPVSSTAAYVAVAAFALIVVVELHVFTPVKLTSGFAVLTVVVLTLAAAGVWAVVRWLAHIYIGTAFYSELDPLMFEFVYSAAAGLLAGVTFEGYFRRRNHTARRSLAMADEVSEELGEQFDLEVGEK